MTPLLWTDSPARGVVAAVVGLGAIALSAMGIVSQGARRGLVGLGLGLWLANLGLWGSVGELANFVVCALAVMAGGLAPSPRVVPSVAAAAPASQSAAAAPEPTDERAAA